MPFYETFIIERGTDSEILLHSCLETIGVSSLSEWDMFVFVYRHGPCLTSTDRIARLIGYEKTLVAAALDHLENRELIERVGPPQGTRIHRVFASLIVEQRRCIRQLVGMSGSCAGRLLLMKLLMPIQIESPTKNN